MNIATLKWLQEEMCEKCAVSYIDFCSIQSILIYHPNKSEIKTKSQGLAVIQQWL